MVTLVFKIPKKPGKHETDASITPKNIIENFFAFSPKTFLTPSDAKIKNKESFKNIPEIQTPR